MACVHSTHDADHEQLCALCVRIGQSAWLPMPVTPEGSGTLVVHAPELDHTILTFIAIADLRSRAPPFICTS